MIGQVVFLFVVFVWMDSLVLPSALNNTFSFSFVSFGEIRVGHDFVKTCLANLKKSQLSENGGHEFACSVLPSFVDGFGIVACNTPCIDRGGERSVSRPTTYSMCMTQRSVWWFYVWLTDRLSSNAHTTDKWLARQWFSPVNVQAVVSPGPMPRSTNSFCLLRDLAWWFKVLSETSKWIAVQNLRMQRWKDVYLGLQITRYNCFGLTSYHCIIPGILEKTCFRWPRAQGFI